VNAAATTEFQQDTVETITNLANVAATYKCMTKTITTTNATLTAQLPVLSEKEWRLTTNPERTAAPNVQVPGPASCAQKGRGRGRGRGTGWIGARTCDQTTDTIDGATAGA
jgi:hypothetical protein